MPEIVKVFSKFSTVRILLLVLLITLGIIIFATTSKTTNESTNYEDKMSINKLSLEQKRKLQRMGISANVEELFNECKRRNENNTSYYSKFIFDLERMECGEGGQKDHCPKNMILYEDADNNTLGFCDCQEHFSNQAYTKYLYHLETDQCYFIHTQGPCSEKEYFSIDEASGETICEFNPCYEFPPRFYYYNGKCHQINDKCSLDANSKFVFEDQYPYCKNNDRIVPSNTTKYCPFHFSGAWGPSVKFGNFSNFQHNFYDPIELLCEASSKLNRKNENSETQNQKKIDDCQDRSSLKTYRYDERRGKCSKIGKIAHCPKNMLFVEKDDKTGYCDCLNIPIVNQWNESDYSTRYVYDPNTDQCYKIFSLETCPENHWVEIDVKTGFKSCELNPCLKNKTSFNEGKMFYYKKSCVKITHSCDGKFGVGFNFLRHYLYPQCRRIFYGYNISARLATYTDKCEPGTYRNIKNKCQKPFEI